MSSRVEDLEERLERIRELETEARVELQRARAKRSGVTEARKLLQELGEDRRAVERLLNHERSVR